MKKQHLLLIFFIFYFWSLYGAYSLDAVASAFFGMQIDSQKDPNNPFVKYAKEAFDMGLTNPKLVIGRKLHYYSLIFFEKFLTLLIWQLSLTWITNAQKVEKSVFINC